MEGYSSELKYGLPVKATIEAESKAVLKVNNQPVTENITIDLSQVNTIEPTTSGDAVMTLSAFGLPVKKVALNVLPGVELVPGGMTVGVRINTDGVMVLGTGQVNGQDGKRYNPADGVLKSGDLILKVNEQELKNKEQLMDIISASDKDISLSIKRKDELISTTIKPVACAEDMKNKIGVWVRDGTQGIGTVTYYNPATNRFAALGHGIMDVDTRELMSIKNGEIRQSEIMSIVKGKKGSPGELIGDTKDKNVIGRVEHNSPYGIFGTVDLRSRGNMPKERLEIGLQDKIHEGPATIRATVEGSKTKDYDIYIENVNRSGSDETKGMVIRITDPELVMKTNGIVQGMSGSPIMQDGRIIGAVTHVFVQDPAKGYGIFIENMLKHEAGV